MKKLKLQEQSKLRLNKERISTLTQEQSQAVAGGFTYSLSTGQVCKASKAVGGENAYECGAILSHYQKCVGIN